MLSMGLFVVMLIEFLLLPQAATSVFFLLMMISLLDVLGGFTITARAARRAFRRSWLNDLPLSASNQDCCCR